VDVVQLVEVDGGVDVAGDERNLVAHSEPAQRRCPTSSSVCAIRRPDRTTSGPTFRRAVTLEGQVARGVRIASSLRRLAMALLYPSWIELPVTDLERALRIYRAVFGLDDTPRYEEPPARIAVLLPSDKGMRAPGVSLVQSPSHVPSPHGVVVNMHFGDHRALAMALRAVAEHGGQIDGAPLDMGDGVRYLTVRDCEGNTLALSSYEPLETSS
jgi:predicted enzyme related to lactoylglutathione lyase